MARRPLQLLPAARKEAAGHLDAVRPRLRPLQGNNIAFNTSTTVASALEGGGSLPSRCAVVGQSRPAVQHGAFRRRLPLRARTSIWNGSGAGNSAWTATCSRRSCTPSWSSRADNVFDKNVVFGIDINYSERPGIPPAAGNEPVQPHLAVDLPQPESSSPTRRMS